MRARTRPRARTRFTRQLLVLQVLVLLAVAGVTAGFAVWQLDTGMRQRFTDRALSVARAVAAEPGLAEAVAADRQPDVQQRALRAQRATGALFVVVADVRGIRLAHPDPAQIGRRVSTSPEAALRGHEVTNIERGTLGLSARGKVPLRLPAAYGAGRIVGEVSVGFDAREIASTEWRLLRDFAGLVALALLLGVGGDLLLTRLLKRRLYGLEPSDLAELVREREAVLFGVSDAVIAVDTDGVVTMLNAEAEELMTGRVRVGVGLDATDLPLALRRAMTDPSRDTTVTPLGERALVVTRRTVRHDDRLLGAVVTIVDRTEMENLTGELEAVRLMTQALRAQRHEFANRMHTVRGLLHTAESQDAADYLDAVADGPEIRIEDAEESLAPAVLRAFLAGKTAEAREAGVTLTLSETTWVPRGVSAPVEVVTVLGNLVNNALEAARIGRVRPAHVEVDLLVDGDDLLITVADSGDGVPEDMRDGLFREGVSSHGAERGLGLSIAQRGAEAQGGRVRLMHPGDDGAPTVFVARLPGVLQSPAPAPDAAMGTLA